MLAVIDDVRVVLIRLIAILAGAPRAACQISFHLKYLICML